MGCVSSSSVPPVPRRQGQGDHLTNPFARADEESELMNKMLADEREGRVQRPRANLGLDLLGGITLGTLSQMNADNDYDSPPHAAPAIREPFPAAVRTALATLGDSLASKFNSSGNRSSSTAASPGSSHKLFSSLKGSLAKSLGQSMDAVKLGGRSSEPLGGIEDDFPRAGVRLADIQEFIARCGGESALAGLPTWSVDLTFVKPFTVANKLSYCEQIALEKGEPTRKAAVFISHAWKYVFLDVVDALEHKFKSDRERTVIWFDLFSVNQHVAPQRAFDWWTSTFEGAIAEFGHTVMILAPWKDPIPLQRAWCLFEVYCSVKTDCVFEVAMSTDELADLFDAVGTNAAALTRMLGAIDVEKSEATNPADKTQIFAIIQELPGGFAYINKMVLDVMQRWMVHATQEAENSEDVFVLTSLARLYETQGRLNQAVPLYDKCLRISSESLGVGHPTTLAALNNLGLIYKQVGKLEDSELAYRWCLRMFEQHMGPEHLDTLQVVNNLASLYKTLGRLDDAEPLCRRCLDLSRTRLGDDHPFTLTAMNNLGFLYRCQRKFDEALRQYELCLHLRSKRLGDDHPDTLQSLHNLGRLREAMGELEKAESLLEKSHALRQSILGDNHPDTLTSSGHLASVLTGRGKFERAEALRLECLHRRMETQGSAHAETIAAAKSLIDLYVKCGRNEEAEAIGTEWGVVETESKTSEGRNDDS